jgi:hypothetical protein
MSEYRDPNEQAFASLRAFNAAVKKYLGLPVGERPADLPTVTCPRCGMSSPNPNDIREGYCGNCHGWTTPR